MSEIINERDTSTPSATPSAPAAPLPAPAQPVAPTVGPDPRRKSPVLASLLSLVPGLGQVYLGYYQRGFLNAIVVASLISLLVADALGPLFPLANLLLIFFWLYNVIDAGRRAALVNETLAGRAQIELPDDFKAPGLAGSVPAGIALIVVGATLLSNTAFGVSLDWLEDWWPLVVIAFGGYLVYRARQESQPATPS